MKLYEVYDIERSTVDPTWREIRDRWGIFPKNAAPGRNKSHYHLGDTPKIFKLINEKYIKIIHIEYELSEIVLSDGSMYLIDTRDLGLDFNGRNLSHKLRDGIPL